LLREAVRKFLQFVGKFLVEVRPHPGKGAKGGKKNETDNEHLTPIYPFSRPSHGANLTIFQSEKSIFLMDPKTQGEGCGLNPLEDILLTVVNLESGF